MPSDSGFMSKVNDAVGGTPAAFYSAAALGAFALYGVAKAYSLRAKGTDDIPQPPGGHWYWGHLPQIQKNAPRLWDFYAEIAESTRDERGAVQLRRFARNPQIVLTDPRDLEFFFDTGFEYFAKRHPDFEKARVTQEVLGHGIFAVDGPEWRRQRKLYSYTFSLKHLREHMFAEFEVLADKLCRKIDGYVESGETFDLQNLFARLTVEGICSIAFAQELGCIEADKTPAFVTAFDLTQIYSSERGRDPLWRLKRWLQIGDREKNMVKEMKIMEDFCYTMIDKIRSGAYDQSKFNIVQLAIDRAAQSGVKITNEELKDIVMSFLIAGRDTTAVAMSWIIFELCRHPEIREKVLEEQQTLDELDYRTVAHETPYLESVFLESLRLHPSVPGDGKLCVKDCTLPSGIKMKNGWLASFHPYVMGRNKNVWGDDVLEFKPERFADGDKQYGEFKYPVFNAGPRLCLGKAMATVESKYILSHLLQRYEFELDATKNEPGQYLISILLWMKGGLQVKAKRRS